MKYLTSLVALGAVSCLALFTSCSSGDDSQSTQEGALGASPMIVTEVEFYAARYSFEFVTETGKVVKITPSGSGTGGATPGIMSVDGISVNVTLAYDLQGDFFDLDNDNPVGDAIGEISLIFTDLGQPALDFFERLGLTFDGAVDTETYELPANSGFLIRVFYLNPGGSSQVAALTAVAPLSAELATWTRPDGVESKGVEVENWLESDFLQGSYLIKRNL